VLRVASNFTLTLAAGTKQTCAEAASQLLKDKRRWEVRSAGKGSKGDRWYAWAWIAAGSPRHHLLVRRHLKTGELAFHKARRSGCSVFVTRRRAGAGSSAHPGAGWILRLSRARAGPQLQRRREISASEVHVLVPGGLAGDG